MRPPRRWLQLGVLAVLATLLVGRWLAVTVADDLWAEALGVAATHAQIRRLRLLLLASAFAAAAVWCLGNLYLVYRSIGSVHVPRRLGNIEILEAVPRHYLLAGAVVLGLGIAVAVSHGAGDWWQARALAGVGTEVALADPILGRTVDYYLFRLPWHRTLHGFATLLGGVMLGVVTLLYLAMGAVRWAERRLRVTDLARSHLAGLLAVFAATLFWGYRLEPAEYVAGVHGVPADAVLTAVRLPVARLLSALALLALGASAVWIWSRRSAIVVAAWIVLAGTSFAGHYVVPAFAGAVRTPSELAVAEVARAREQFVALAFGPQPSVEWRRVRPAPPAAVAAHQEALAGAPVWDRFAVTAFLDRVAGEGMARFTDATLGVYPGPDRRGVPVYVAARRVDPDAAEVTAAVTWEDLHLGRLAWATGAVAVDARRVSETGLPLFVPDLARPEQTVADVRELGLREPAIRFAPGLTQYAVVPSGGGSALGVGAGGPLRRLALAWVLQSRPLLTSAAVTDTSRVLWTRGAVERLERYAPFAVFGDPAAVIVDRRLLWIANGLVSREAFPLAPAQSWRSERVRYLRSSFVGVVEAASGRTTVYLLPEPDPLSVAWARLAPEVVRPAADMPPELLPHVRYPEELFAVQRAIAGQAVWATADMPAPSAARPVPERGPAFWSAEPTTRDPVARLRLRGVEERGTPASLVGTLEGTVRGGVLRLEAVGVAPPDRLPATAQVLGALDGETVAGDDVALGTVRTALFEDGALVWRSRYAMPTEGVPAAPRLVAVLTGWSSAASEGRAAAAGPTLGDALARLARAVPRGRLGGEWDEARRWFQRMDDARRRGDWAAFGEAYETLRRILGGAPDTLR